MHLILGNREDVLVSEVSRQFEKKGLPACLINEADLFSGTPFAFRRNATRTEGFLRIEGQVIPLASLSAVLVRMPLMWWPAEGLDLQDQMFVYHETRASHFALLSSLSCTVVNRFSLAWWVHDLTYPESITLDLAQRLNCEAAVVVLDPRQGRLFPTGPDHSPTTANIYLAGCRFIPANRAPHAVNKVAEMSQAVADWQSESGIKLCRLDFDIAGATPRLRYVEPFPVVDGESPEVVRTIATATLEVLL
jgi:hypothetical protein